MSKNNRGKTQKGWAAILAKYPHLARHAAAMGIGSVKVPAVQAAIEMAKEQELEQEERAKRLEAGLEVHSKAQELAKRIAEAAEGMAPKAEEVGKNLVELGKQMGTTVEEVRESLTLNIKVPTGTSSTLEELRARLEQERQERIAHHQAELQKALQEELLREVESKEEERLAACCPGSCSWSEWRAIQKPMEVKRIEHWQAFKARAYQAGQKSGYFANVSDKPQIFGA